MHPQVNKGVAYADGKILVATLDTKLYALDAKTGKTLWRLKTVIRSSVRQ